MEIKEIIACLFQRGVYALNTKNTRIKTKKVYNIWKRTMSWKPK